MKIESTSTETAYIFTKAELVALCAFASRDIARTNTRGVRFVPALGHAVATDGHRLTLAATSEKGEGREVTLHVDDLTALAKSAKTKQLVRVVIPPAPAQCYGLVVGATVSQGLAYTDSQQYPPYAQIIPKTPAYPPADAFGINASYLASVALIADACGKTGVRVLPPPSELDPIVFRCTHHDGPTATEWTCVIMPARI